MSTAEAESHLRENPFELAKSQLRRVGEIFALDPNLIRVLSQCKKAVEVSIPVAMDDGAIDSSRATASSTTPRAARPRGAFATTRTSRWTTSSAGDEDDLEVRPDGTSVRRRQGRRELRSEALSAGELERLTRRFTSALAPNIGPERDIPAPDVGTDGRVMAWILDTYAMNRGTPIHGVVTGKPLAIGGTLGREKATARGLVYCIQACATKQRLRLRETALAIQGYGNVGANPANAPLGVAKVVAVSDSPAFG